MQRQIYFAKFRDRIKVGITSNLPQRMETLRYQFGEPAIIATAFGDYGTERALHFKLREYHICREFFRDCPEVRAAAEKVSSGDYSDLTLPVHDQSDKNWFAIAVASAVPTNPGGALSELTGFGFRNCQRYAAGKVKPPADFLRSLLRSDQGWDWLCAAMDGCEQEWWAHALRAKNYRDDYTEEVAGW